jgi:hypothetical protein
MVPSARENIKLKECFNFIVHQLGFVCLDKELHWLTILQNKAMLTDIHSHAALLAYPISGTVTGQLDKTNNCASVKKRFT